MSPIAFHAPLKAPDHPEPSGDREFARLFVKALQRAGFEVELACGLRMFEGTGDTARMAQLAGEARDAAEDYAAQCRQRPPERRPRLIFTYHVHYKAPDVFAPAVAERLGLPYVIAEGSRAPKRADGPFALGHSLAEAAIARADCVLIVNPRDRPMLEVHRPAAQALVDLPPFLDAGAWPDRAGERPSPSGRLRLLSVAMMRHGDKLRSFALLAQTLVLLPAGGWVLDIVGDGPARGEVEAMFRPFGKAVRLHGLVRERDRLAGFYASAELLVWPAVNEAFGMVFLEAALQGCPAVAGSFGGVAGVVADGVGGLLTAPGEVTALAHAIGQLAGERGRLAAMGVAARRNVLRRHSLDGAATTLRALLWPLARRDRVA